VPTPYVTPDMLVNAPTGISWGIIPYPQAITGLQTAEQYNICGRATGLVDNFCNQVLRATADTEYRNGPDFQVTVQQSTGLARLTMQRWPVLSVLAISVSPNSAMPRTWTTLPSQAYDVERPVIGIYGSSAPSAAGDGGQGILVASGYVDWSLGRNGYRIAVSYLNGWPHTSLTQNASSGATTLHVDDVTAFTGASATIFDGANTEAVTVTSVAATTNLVLPISGLSVPAGPGTLTINGGGLLNNHGANVVVSSLPQDILWATILAATAQALESGIDAIAIQNVNGSQTVGGHGVSELQTEYEVILAPYKRVI
jgi:hypothetical protein